MNSQYSDTSDGVLVQKARFSLTVTKEPETSSPTAIFANDRASQLELLIHRYVGRIHGLKSVVRAGCGLSTPLRYRQPSA